MHHTRTLVLLKGRPPARSLCVTSLSEDLNGRNENLRIMERKLLCYPSNSISTKLYQNYMFGLR